MKIRNQKAVTLVEILVAVTIFAFLMAAIYQAFLVGNRSWASYSVKVATQREARWALYAMGKDLRAAKNILITKDDEKQVLSLEKPGVGLVAYTYYASGPKSGELTRAEKNKERVIARNIIELVLDYPTTEAMIINITASQKPLFSGTITFNLKEKFTIKRL